MYEELVNSLRYCATHSCIGEAPALTGCTAIYDDAPKGCDSCNAVLQWQAADAIEELLKVASALHTWIFLHTGDEQAAYDECGLTDEMNVELGYGRQYVIEPPKEET